MSDPSDRWMVFDGSHAPPSLGGFIDAQTAFALERRRRRVRIAAALAGVVWTMASIGSTNAAGVEGLPALVIWLSGLAAIGMVAREHWRRSGDGLSSMVAVDEHGRPIGRADQVGRVIVQERAIPALAGFAVFHWIGRIEYVAGLDGPVRTGVTLAAVVIGVAVAWRLQRAATHHAS